MLIFPYLLLKIRALKVLAAILSEMADEAERHGGVVNKNYFIIEDRGEAIRKAVSLGKQR